MSTHVRSVPAAATGAVFAGTLILANGDGGTLSDMRDVAATAALTLLVPFAVYLGAVLRAHSLTPTDTWLAATAAAAGAVGACMKLLSGAPETAAAHAGIVPGDPAAKVMTGMADAITLLSLFPLALFCLATGTCALRTRGLPTWLGIGALVTGAGLALNGCLRNTQNVPALLLFTLWCLVTSAQQTRAARREHAHQSPTHTHHAA